MLSEGVMSSDSLLQWVIMNKCYILLFSVKQTDKNYILSSKEWFLFYFYILLDLLLDSSLFNL